jgi:hypothetical protein
MAAINLRRDKERPLTIEEVDNNFDNINREVGTKLDATALNAPNILTILDGKAGAGSTLDADKVQGKYPSTNAYANTVAMRDSVGNITAVQFYGLLVGNVIGNLNGNVTGTVTGNATNVDGTVQVDHGGTGAVTAAGARSNLGLGSIAVQNSNTVSITGGDITGITDLAVADGGTGASTSAGARSNLGLVIGADVQAYAAILSGLSATTGNGFVSRSSTNSAVARKLVAGNSIEITNVDGQGGDPTIALTLNPTVTAITKSGTNGSGDIGQTGNRFAVIYGTSTSARYADLAERYTADGEYDPGTVMVVSLSSEVDSTASFRTGQRVLGVVSTNPAHIMNDECDGPAIALRGRVPVKVVGPIHKGDALICNQDGKGIAGDTVNSFAIALETNLEAGVKLVECVIL